MKKIHIRLSVELDVTDEQFAEVVRMAKANNPHGGYYDVDYGLLPQSVQTMINVGKYRPCDWDDGGYIPSSWIKWDAEGVDD